MHLRHKFGVLALIYVLSLTGTVATSVWCIGYYFHSALRLFEPTFEGQDSVERLRNLVGKQRDMFEVTGGIQRLSDEYQRNQEEINSGLSRLAPTFSSGDDAPRWSLVEQASEGNRQAVSDYIKDATSRVPKAETLAVADVDDAFDKLDRALARMSQALSLRRTEIVDQVSGTQETVLRILLANAAGGALLCIVGLVFVQKWVTRPVARLRDATKHISKGDFSYRIVTRSRDEIGLLANEVNGMCATIVAIQTRLVEQERLAAAGEMVTSLAHNIRNPLGGLRGLAESTLQRHEDDEQTAECQRRIIETVDRFEKWLRDLQHSVSPLTLNIVPAQIASLIENVATVLRPMAERRNVELKVVIDPKIDRVGIDGMHIEQALVALMTNALQASRPNTMVTVSATPDDETPGHWCLSVEDEGEGVPPELRERIFLLYYTTKADGSGLGLAMANKIVKLHGGRLELESEVGKGSRFTARMPGLVAEE